MSSGTYSVGDGVSRMALHERGNTVGRSPIVFITAGAFGIA